MKYFISLSIILLISFQSIKAQEKILTGGGNLTGNGGNISFSIGQISFNTSEGTDGSNTETIQQPFELYVFPGITEKNFAECTLSPNPAGDFVNLSSGKQLLKNARYRISTVTGEEIKSQEIKNNPECIPVNDLSPGIYTLSLISQDNFIKNFKLIRK